MAHNTLRDDLQTRQVKLKRYFYALRPALACLWIVERQTVPPMEFEHLRVMIIDNEVQNAIDELLETKKTADEKALIAPVLLLNQWLSATLDYCKERIPMLSSEKKYPDELNSIFRKFILP
jgi:predicted nucleotidyltransferase